jgi:hypothetical protein
MDASAAVRAACLMVWNTDHIGSCVSYLFMCIYQNFMSFHGVNMLQFMVII